MNSCEICPILETHNNGKDIQILESDYWRVVLDPNQRFLGKLFVTLLEHKPTLSDLSLEQWDDLHSVMKKLEGAIKQAFQPSHFNWSCLMNIAAMNDQQTHVHWHLHPRYAEPITVNGEVFEDTEWYPRKEKTNHVASEETLRMIADTIKGDM